MVSKHSPEADGLRRSGSGLFRSVTTYLAAQRGLRVPGPSEAARAAYEDAIQNLWRSIVAICRLRPGGILGYESEDIATEVLMVLASADLERATPAWCAAHVRLLVRRRIHSLVRQNGAQKRRRRHDYADPIDYHVQPDGEIEAHDPSPTPEELLSEHEDLCAWREAWAKLGTAAVASLKRTKTKAPETKWWLMEERCLHEQEWDDIASNAPPVHAAALAGSSRNTMQAQVTKLLAGLAAAAGDTTGSISAEHRAVLARLVAHLQSGRHGRRPRERGQSRSAA